MLKKYAAAAVCIMGMGVAHAFLPQAGTWVVNSELNGKPGRGLAMDVQKGTLVMQMYAYDNTGRATFYLATGPVVNNEVTADLKSYEGGRYLGSGDRSGVERANMGAVKLRFVDGANGFITLPGEPEKAISRFNFGYGAVPESLRGGWFFTSYSPSTGWIVETPELSKAGPATTDGSGLIASSDASYACEHQIRGVLAGHVVCIKMNAARSATQKTYVFRYSVNDGEGDWLAANSNTAYGLYVKRALTSDGQAAWLIRKSQAVDDTPLTPAQEQQLAGHLGAAIAEVLER